jgi:hypothetical protein
MTPTDRQLADLAARLTRLEVLVRQLQGTGVLTERAVNQHEAQIEQIRAQIGGE